MQDFRQRENDFEKCRNAQNIRRSFYYPDAEANTQIVIQFQDKYVSFIEHSN